jgi:hypothetical protein
MHRIALYAAAAVAVIVPAVLVGSALWASEDDQVDRIVGSLERDRLESILDAAAFEDGGLVVSAGQDAQRFGAAGRDAARALLEERTGIEGAQSVRLRQRQVTVREGSATAILNVELDGGDWVALRLDLSRRDDRWIVERIRVMG